MNRKPTIRDASKTESHATSAAPDALHKTATAARRDVFVGRQPIFDRQLNVIAYELLYRSSEVNQAGAIEPYQATARVILNTVVEIGLDTLVGSKRAFINVTRGFLLSGHVAMFPADRIGVEVEQGMAVDAEVLEVLRVLSSLGYTIALDGLIYHDSLRPLVTLADTVKLDVCAMDRPTLEKQVAFLRQFEIALLAKKVATQEVLRYCMDLGFDYVQGYFLCQPEVVQGKQMPTSRLSLLRVLAELQHPEVDFEKVEAVISQDVSLSYRMLRMVNSAYYATQREIDTIGRALRFLGTNTITGLTSLLLLANIDDKPHELLRTAMVRAKMCEQLSNAPDKDTFFLVGLLSVLDALMGCPMHELLQALPLTEDVTRALLSHEGVLGATLRCILAYERGNWHEAMSFGLDRESMVDAYLTAIAWADEMSHTLTQL